MTTTAIAMDVWSAADELLAHRARLAATDPRRATIRDTVICDCLPEARREAARYRNSSETFADLVQVASLGLVLAVDRFDPDRGVPFKHFALPTITGELKRHFRDRRWSVRVTRRVQELCQLVRKAEPALTQALGRQPTDADLARHLDIPAEAVREAWAAEGAHNAYSLNYPTGHDDDPGELGEHLGDLDRALEAVPEHDALVRAWPRLPERQRVILSLRFADDLSQNQIAEKMGISQMHVSRLISRSLTTLRRHMDAEQPT